MNDDDEFIQISGHFGNYVLGSFRVIRGFASLVDLAKISVPFTMSSPSRPGMSVEGHQREIDPEHAEQIRRYLEQGEYRFMPEIILSVRATYTDIDRGNGIEGVKTTGIRGFSIVRRTDHVGRKMQVIRVRKDMLDEVICTERRIRRIDGNHRLHLASELKHKENEQFRYNAPFCAILLGEPKDERDDYVESIIFHTINSKAKTLPSEHALQLVLGLPKEHRPSGDEEFRSDPVIYLTRIVAEWFSHLPQPQHDRLGPTPAAALNAAAAAALVLKPELAENRRVLKRFGKELVGGLNEVLARLPATQRQLTQSDFFVELATRAWVSASTDGHDTRCGEVCERLQSTGEWLGREGLDQLTSSQSIAGQIHQIHEFVQRRKPRRVFLARWYPTAKDGEELAKANLRKNQISRALDDLRLEGIDLSLDDPGTQVGTTFPIHQEMYKAIARNDIMLIDLSGVRPNVCVEAGYALDHHKPGRLVFLFQPTSETPNNPAQLKPPFDLNTFRYEPINDSGEIPDKIKPHLREICRAAESGG